jgi:hypothetical protein
VTEQALMRLKIHRAGCAVVADGHDFQQFSTSRSVYVRGVTILMHMRGKN